VVIVHRARCEAAASVGFVSLARCVNTDPLTPAPLANYYPFWWSLTPSVFRAGRLHQAARVNQVRQNSDRADTASSIPPKHTTRSERSTLHEPPWPCRNGCYPTVFEWRLMLVFTLQ
jgi:hypothetical protein